LKKWLALVVVVGVGVTSAATALAVTTRTFRVTSYKDLEEGEATGVLLSSLGEASAGFGASRVDVSEAVVYAAATAPDGTVWLGTGDQGAVYAYAKGKLRKVAKLEQATLVASLAIGPGGTVFAGTMPGGRVYVIDRDGRARELAKLDAEHVWALAYDESRKTLYAATGPAGRLFAIDVRDVDKTSGASGGGSAARARLIYETGEKHLLSLVRGDDGALYAGSADQAILYRIAPDASGARVQALHDFEGEEVRAIARRGPTLYVAVNEFTKSSSSLSTSSSGGPLAPRGTKIVLPATPATPSATTPSLPSRDRKGKGAVYRVDPDGRVEQLHALADGYFTALHVDADGNVYAASGANGRVYLIRPDRTVITAFDLPERQVLTLALDGPERVLGTGDAGALYKVTSEPPKDAHYLTKVFDAQFPARWGNLRWSGAGAITVQTRSGNTSKPDKTWSAWQPLGASKRDDGAVGHVPSPDGRYLQARVNFGGARTVLRDVTIYYQPQNQRQRVSEITVGDEATAKRVPLAARAGRPRSPIVKLKWKVENPDDDELVYRLFFREESEVNWKPLGGPEPLTRTDWEWNTESIPDGNYVVKVVASDERANPKEEALTHELTSSPFLVDNRKPELGDVKIAYPWASGRARDSFSPITELAYSIDGGEWQPFGPRDGIFDDPVEDFSVKLPAGLAAGTHSLAVRAVDAADNVGAAQLTFRVQ
jgi:sugar lactone lactonase YvrE